MKKLVLLAVCLCVSVGFVKAQKVEGTLSFLKQCEELNVVFDYKGMMIKKQTEKEYVAEKVKEKNKEKKGQGDEWKTEWETTTRDFIQSAFLKDFNAEFAGMGLEAGEFPEAEYVATVKTTWLDPGFMAGPMSKPSSVSVEVVFKKKNSSTVLAKVTINKAKGSLYDFGNLYAGDERRIGSSYGEAAQDLGKLVAKTLKKK